MTDERSSTAGEVILDGTDFRNSAHFRYKVSPRFVDVESYRTDRRRARPIFSSRVEVDRSLSTLRTFQSCGIRMELPTSSTSSKEVSPIVPASMG